MCSTSSETEPGMSYKLACWQLAEANTMTLRMQQVFFFNQI